MVTSFCWANAGAAATSATVAATSNSNLLFMRLPPFGPANHRLPPPF
jgi:hypothetical protein